MRLARLAFPVAGGGSWRLLALAPLFTALVLGLRSAGADDTDDLVLTKKKPAAGDKQQSRSDKKQSPLFRPAPTKPATRPSATATAKTPAPKAIELSPSSAGSDLEIAWYQHFAKHEESPASVRETARVLMQKKKYGEVVCMLRGALRSGQPQPWMYEAMAIAMELNQAPQEEIERVLMSAVDFASSPEELLTIGQFMARMGLDARALQIFRQVSHANPLQPEPYALGLKIARRLNDTESLGWATAGILRQAWPNDQQAIWDDAYRVANGTITELRAQKRDAEADAFQDSLDEALVRDCIVKISWTGQADIDLIVEEPSGTICSLSNPRSTSGGVILGDVFTKPDSDEVATEVYSCPQAFNGTYRVLIRRVWGKVTAGTVTVDLYVNHHSKYAEHQRKQITLGEKDSLVVFDLNRGRRVEPLREHQLAKAGREQFAVGRAVLAQQLSQQADPSLGQGLGNDRARALALLGRRGGAVGYQPVIVPLPEGTNFSVTGVISADRRYVRVTPRPTFSQIGDVTTFTVSGPGAGTTSTTSSGGTGTGGSGTGTQ